MKVRANEEVREALGEGRPVIALESTIISHGMPYPQNVETAMNVERILREADVVPATVGIVDGEGVVGLSEAEIEELGRRGAQVPKVSRRDLPVIMAEGSWGATTVATTMILAAKAGVEFFVTGGIGGVHRGAEMTFDVSADLEELGRTNVTVICAGAKAILDLPKTLEVLETKGVPVLGFGTDELPAFYTRTSGLPVDRRVENAEEVARIVRANVMSEYNQDYVRAVVVSGARAPWILMKHVVRNCIIDAAFIGLLPTGNQFNIISGVMYPTKEGYTFLLKKLGIKYIIQKTPMQDISEKCAAVSCKVNYNSNGENNSFSIVATIKKDSYSSMDQILGKAERKAKKALFEYITGCDFGDADEQSGMPGVDDQTATPVQTVVQAKIDKIRNSGKAPDQLL